MPKINQEEYEILKKLDDKWKWIARDENRGLYAFTKKPVRKDGPSSYWWDADGWDAEPYAALGLVDEIHLFQFIQWEDEEPYNIAELIREYEKHEFVKINHEGQERLNKLFGNESEEKEMKDIEWLRKEFDDLFNGKSILTVGKSVVDEIINQLDEPETLSQEWIEEHKESWKDLSVTGYSVPEKDLQNLLVPKQNRQKDWAEFTDFLAHERIFSHEDKEYIVIEKPVIPRFVADWLEDLKSREINLLEHIYDFTHDEDINSYIREQGNTIMRAWLDGYEIEPEPQYRLKAGENYLYFNLDGTVRGSTKKNAVITKERLEKLPFDVEMAVLSGIIEVEELEE